MNGQAPLLLRPHEVTTTSPVGGKARALAEAGRAGLMVPPWFVITPDAAADAGFQPALAAALAELCPAGEPVAVRSSASDEDGAAHSFAGQLESFLFVSPADVEARVRDVWQSGLSDRVVEYRRHHHLPLPPSLPAVLVQRMVQPRTAGVAFAADPVSGRRAVAIVSAVLGVGTGLVSGEGDADTWQVDRSGAIVARSIVNKRTKHVGHVQQPFQSRRDQSRRDHPPLPLPSALPHERGRGGQGGEGEGSTAEGVQTVDVDGADARAPALTDRQIVAVAALARAASRCFGRPQDIEWAMDDGQLFLLQSRPITTLSTIPDPDSLLSIWDNSNIVESYSGVTTPLTFSFASEIYQGVYRQFCRLMGVSEEVLADEDDTFRNMLGLIHGRLYYNLLNWYRVLALLPGFTVNRRFMEQMMGVRESLPESVKIAITPAAQRGKLSDSLALGRMLLGLIGNYMRLPRQIARFTQRLDEALAPPAIPLSDQRPDELAEAYRTLRRKLLTRWDAPLVNDFFAMIFYGVLRQLTARWCGDREGTLQNDLVGGEGGMVSAEPAQRMQAMARLAADAADAADAPDAVGPSIGETLRTGSVEAARAAIARAPALQDAFDAYLEKFGERCVNELKLESATLHDDPLPLLRAVGHLAQQPAARAEGQGAALRQRARDRAEAALARRPLRRLLFGWVLRNARARVRDRENLRLERTRLFGRVRRLFVELGHRLHAVDRLDDPRDIFYLEVDEVLAFVEGRATCTDLRGLVRVRRAEFASYADAAPANQPADRFDTHGMVYQGHTFQRTTAPDASAARSGVPDAAATGDASAAGAPNDDARQGLGCCPGLVRGPVRVVFDPRTVALDRHTILVAEHTDPGWIMIFPSATGLLVERGSLLSHAAIVARELGIPAIVSVPGVTQWLRDGDWVEMDGATGRVRRLPPEEVASANMQEMTAPHAQ